MTAAANGIRAFIIESVLDHICPCPCVTSRKRFTIKVTGLKSNNKTALYSNFLALNFLKRKNATQKSTIRMGAILIPMEKIGTWYSVKLFIA